MIVLLLPQIPNGSPAWARYGYMGLVIIDFHFGGEAPKIKIVLYLTQIKNYPYLLGCTIEARTLPHGLKERKK